MYRKINWLGDNKLFLCHQNKPQGTLSSSDLIHVVEERDFEAEKCQICAIVCHSIGTIQ